MKKEKAIYNLEKIKKKKEQLILSEKKILSEITSLDKKLKFKKYNKIGELFADFDLIDIDIYFLAGLLIDIKKIDINSNTFYKYQNRGKNLLVKNSSSQIIENMK